MQDLVDWTSFTSEEIKYFSGTATYTTNFVLEDIPSAEQVFMDIGMANIMANIRLNGEYAGTLWTAPWKVDVTNHLKKGENQLQIEVTNLWVNQLIRDGQRSKDDKHTWTLQPNRYKQESELQPSGLEGPVHLLSY
jgi:beta-galactosidase/beta-glucuronidase